LSTFVTFKVEVLLVPRQSHINITLQLELCYLNNYYRTHLWWTMLFARECLTSSTMVAMTALWAHLQWSCAVRKGMPHKFYHGRHDCVASTPAMEQCRSQRHSAQMLPWSQWSCLECNRACYWTCSLGTHICSTGGRGGEPYSLSETSSTMCPSTVHCSEVIRRFPRRGVGRLSLNIWCPCLEGEIEGTWHSVLDYHI